MEEPCNTLLIDNHNRMFILIKETIDILKRGNDNRELLYDGDCSIQRLYEIIIEEAPSPFINNNMRDEIGHAVIGIAKKYG